jgi:hypothetical protein
MSETRPTGRLSGVVIPAPIQRPAIRTVQDAIAAGAGSRAPWSGLTREVGKWLNSERVLWQDANFENFQRSLAAQRAAEQAAKGGAMAAVGHLWLAKVDARGKQTDLGLASCRVVTTAGVNFIVDAFQGIVEPEVMRFHGVGTGGAAEAVGNTALTTELTTQYQVSNTRPTGSLGELSGSANVFETTATVTVSAGVAITEHGIFSQAAVAGGVLLDRTLFAAVNLASGESLQAQYDLTFTAGG